MSFLLNLPGIIKILVTLFLILLLNRSLKSLVGAVFIGTVVFAFWSGQTVESAASIAWARVSGTSTLILAAIIVQVIWLSSQMKRTGVMRDLVGAVRSRVSRRASMAVLPAVIGLLPMPGGALFSAPMVDDLDREKTVPELLKTKINYWYRHVWEYWWPLYPGVLMAIDLSGLPVWQFLLLQLPLSLFSMLAGYLFLLRKVPEEKSESTFVPNKSAQGIFRLTLPIQIVVVVYTLIRLFFPDVAVYSKYLPMFIGLIFAILILQLQRPLSLREWGPVLGSRSVLKMLAIIFAVIVYGAFIAARLPGGTLLMDQVRGELTGAGIPIVMIIVALPFISGLATGIALGFVGASFPIVMNLLGASPSNGTLLAYTVLAFGSGYVGMLLSPVHICLVVSNEYFKTSLLHSLYKLLPPAAMVMGGTVFVHLLVRLIFI